MAGTDAFITIAAYYYGRLNNIELPTYNFTSQYDENGMTLTLTIRNGKKPTQVLLWEASNEKARDFRVQTIGKSWTSTPLEPSSSNQQLIWKIYVKNPSVGYRAFLIEITFDNYFKLPIAAPLKFTTSTYIVPNKLPCQYPH